MLAYMHRHEADPPLVGCHLHPATTKKMGRTRRPIQTLLLSIFLWFLLPLVTYRDAERATIGTTNHTTIS